MKTNLPKSYVPNLLACLLALSTSGCHTGSSSGVGGLARSPYNLGPAANPAGAIGLKTMNGVPIGNWFCEFKNPVPVGVASIRVVFNILDDGSAVLRAAYVMQYKPGYSIGMGKFAGLKLVAWTTEKKYFPDQVKRVGNEIMIYSTPSRNSTVLTTGNPVGHTLKDYDTVGGVLPDGLSKTSGLGIEGGVCIYDIKGKDLILKNSYDGNRWLFKHM